MSKHQDLEGKFNGSTDFLGVLSLGGVILSSVLLFTPAKAMGYIGVGSGLGSFAASVVARKKHLETAKSHIDSLVNHQRKELNLQNDLLLVKDNEIAVLRGSISKGFTQIETLKQSLQQSTEQGTKLQNQIDCLTVQNQSQKQLIEQVTGELDRLIDLARTAVEESLDEWNARLNSLVSSKRERYPKLSERLNELLQEGESQLCDYAVKLAETPRKWDSLADLLSLFYCLNDDLQHTKTTAIQAIAKLSIQEKELEIREVDEILEEWQSAKLVPLEKVKELIAKYEAMLQEFRVDIHQRFEGVMNVKTQLESGMSEDEEFFLRLRMQIQRLEETVATLQAKLNEAHQIRLFDDVGWKSEVANKVLDHFQLNEIVCDACPFPIREMGGELEFYITPRTRIGMNLVASDIEKVGDSLQIQLGTKIKVAIDGKNIRVRIPFENREVKKISPEDVLNRPVSVWVVYLGSEYHTVIFAATQSGKTSLADELDAMQYVQLGGLVEFRAITLKNDGNRDEEKKQRFVKPEFMPSNREYMQALGDIHEAIEQRNQILGVNPDYRFPRLIFQLDEYGEYFRLGQEDEKKAGKEAIISLLQRGAGLSSETGKGISLTLIAQNPYVSLLGLNKPDFANACIVIVGEKNIRLFIESDPANHGLDEEDLWRLKGELKIFKEASRIASEKAAREAEKSGVDVALAIRKCPENYYSLIIPSKGGLPPVIVYNPKPGKFTNGLMKAEKVIEKPTCPDCSTPSERRKGNSERYYCDNRECKRQTFTWKGLA